MGSMLKPDLKPVQKAALAVKLFRRRVIDASKAWQMVKVAAAVGQVEDLLDELPADDQALIRSGFRDPQDSLRSVPKKTSKTATPKPRVDFTMRGLMAFVTAVAMVSGGLQCGPVGVILFGIPAAILCFSLVQRGTIAARGQSITARKKEWIALLLGGYVLLFAAPCVIYGLLPDDLLTWQCLIGGWLWTLLLLARCRPGTLLVVSFIMIVFMFLLLPAISSPNTTGRAVDVANGREGRRWFSTLTFARPGPNTAIIQSYLGQRPPRWTSPYYIGSPLLTRFDLEEHLALLPHNEARHQVVTCLTDARNLLRRNQGLLLVGIRHLGYPGYRRNFRLKYTAQEWWEKHSLLFECEYDDRLAKRKVAGWQEAFDFQWRLDRTYRPRAGWPVDYEETRGRLHQQTFFGSGSRTRYGGGPPNWNADEIVWWYYPSGLRYPKEDQLSRPRLWTLKDGSTELLSYLGLENGKVRFFNDAKKTTMTLTLDELSKSERAFVMATPQFYRSTVLATLDAAIAKTVTPAMRIHWLEKMRACVANGDTELSFFKHRLTTLPPEIGILTKLTKLDLRGSRLTAVPREIGKLKNLTELSLGINRLTTLPPEIGKLANLTTLNLRANQLTTLPPEIGKLSNLKILNLSGNQFKSLPPEIGKLTNLKVLNLGSSSLTKLPPEIGKLANLDTLILPANPLTALPPELGMLSKLTKLNLLRNSITDADLKHLKVLQNLYELDIRLTKITKEGAAELEQALPSCRIQR